MFLSRKHALEQITIAQKDGEGKFSWVEFIPPFHSDLVRAVFALLNGRPATQTAQPMLKRSLPVLILELLNQEFEDDLYMPFKVLKK